MPVYNREGLIAEAVRSALDSSFTDFELLIVDDGSTDASLAMAVQAAAGDARLRILRVEHGGVAAARNAGLGEARGEFIANLDSDDAMFPGRLAAQVAYLDAHSECAAVGTRTLIMNSAGSPIAITQRYFTHEDIDRSLMAGNGGAIGNDSAMFRRSSAQAIGGYEAELRATGEDHDFWLRLAERGQLANLPVVLNRYRVHDTNVSTGDGARERRLPITLDTLRRAFARRGIANRKAEKLPTPPLSKAEHWADRGLVLYFRGQRLRAVAFGFLAWWVAPQAPAIRGALRTIVRGVPARP